ncbi:uncharacterized protein LOC141790309 isoform X3 [Halichoeres trimaculatus]|uniref:uncharacterized protein LOC141790309 isoform X3 n=1 Tax=Halichoeres trimaculatus TaxID=147232 RepID=UPI003D9EC17D
MTDTDRDGEKRDTGGTDELLYPDLNVNITELKEESQTLKLDHCDLLLDVIDAQLGQLQQVQSLSCQAVFRGSDCNSPAPPRWSKSLSKDTGLGSTTLTNDTPMSCLDLIQTPSEQMSERSTDFKGDPVTPEEAKQKLDRRTREKEGRDSQREQVIWRLEKLLGDTCSNGEMSGESHAPSDSICTEDFVARFRDEMVELALPESEMQERDTEEEETERKERSDCDSFQGEQKQKSVCTIDRGETAITGRSNKDTEADPYPESKKICARRELEKCFSDSFTVNRSYDETGAGEGYKTPQILGECGAISYRADNKGEAEQQDFNAPPKTRCLAGVPMWNFDTVSIDSDLDSISTEDVRQHIQKQPGWRSLIQSVLGMDDYSSNQSGCDTATPDDSESTYTSEKRERENSSRGKIQTRSSSSRTAERKKREIHRVVCSFDVNDNDTDEETNPCWRRCRPDRMSEKMQSDCAETKAQLSTLQQRCQKEEETLLLKKTQLRDADFSLSDLQQKKKHALLELECLIEETAKMEKEKSRLKFVLEDWRAKTDSVKGQLYERHKQRKSCIVEPSVLMSVLEREELDRQLHGAKTELFAEQKRAREKLESMQEKLEETREELQRATEAESLLRARCACLEEKQEQKTEQMKVELGEYRMKVGTLEKMLAQKGLQVVDLKEQCLALKAERDRLKGELQHIQTQHCNELKEAEEKVHRMTVKKQSEAERADTLKKQAVSLKWHIESLKSTIKLKDEEERKMRDSLEQQKKEAINREEELRVEALGKVHEALEEARRKWEAEKVEAVQVHCAILEEQNRKSQETMRSEMQQEKSRTVALQQKRVQKLESESSMQQREQESVLAVVCKSLKEEHQAELQKMQRQMAEESQRAAQQLELSVQLAKKEADRLRLMLEEKERNHRGITAELDQQLRHCAQELRAESQHLLLLMEQSGAKQSSVELSHSSTVAEGLTNLRVLREELKHMINHLQQELDTQKETTEQLGKAKERELSIQRHQLRMERDQAMDCLKERLIQEHIEELSSLNVAHMCEGGAEGGGLAASLRKQLKNKDLELRQVQRSMAQWKEQTAARLACKFEEQLTAELERCKTKLLRGRKTSKTREETQRKPDRSNKDRVSCAKEVWPLVCSPSLHVAASHSSSDVASLKLLSYLQSRVKQLRFENQTNTSTPLSSNTIPLGSYLATITQDISGTESLLPISSVSN